MAQSVYIDCRFVRYHAYIQIAPTARKSHKRTDGMGKAAPPPPASPHGDTMDGASLARRGNATDTGKATANASDRDDQPRHAPVYDTTDGAMIAATGRSGGKENRKRQDGEKSGEQSGAGTR